MFFVSKKGTLEKDLTTLPSKGLSGFEVTFTGLEAKHSSWRKKCLLGFEVTFTGLEAEHSFL